MEGRLGDTSGGLTWIVGGYYFDEAIRGASTIYQSDALQHYFGQLGTDDQIIGRLWTDHVQRSSMT